MNHIALIDHNCSLLANEQQIFKINEYLRGYFIKELDFLSSLSAKLTIFLITQRCQKEKSRLNTNSSNSGKIQKGIVSVNIVTFLPFKNV